MLRATVAAVFFLPLVLHAQPDSSASTPHRWDLSAIASLQHGQAAYSDNWGGDERGSLSWTALFQGSAEKKLSKLTESRTTLHLEFGQNALQAPGTNRWSKPQKTVDRIDLESVLSFTLGIAADPFVSGRAESQFLDQRGGQEHTFNPLILTESAGFGRRLWGGKNRSWTLRLGGASKQRIDRNYLFADSSRGSEVVTDLGLSAVSELATPLFGDRARLSARVSIFQALYNSRAKNWKNTEREDSWRWPDMDAEMTLSAALSEWLNFNLNARWLYDRELDKAGRFKETLSLGLTWTLL